MRVSLNKNTLLNNKHTLKSLLNPYKKKRESKKRVRRI